MTLSLEEAIKMPRLREENEIRMMLKEALILKQEWKDWLDDPDCKSDRTAFAEAVRNYNALKGVVQSLQWVLRHPAIRDPLW
jgi:hypothetical protein